MDTFDTTFGSTANESDLTAEYPEVADRYASTAGSARDEAHRLLDLGYTSLPADPAKKHPPFAWKQYQRTPPTHEELDRLFDRYPTATGVGIVPNGMVVLDLDAMPDGSPNPFPEDPAHRMALSCAPAVETPGGGLHLYFRAPIGIAIKNSVSLLAPRVDVRAAGGFLMVPPSARDGRAYEWRGDDVLDVPPDQLPELPQFILDLLGVTATAPAMRSYPVPLDGVILEGQRNDTLFKLAAKWRGMGHRETEILALLERHNSTRCVPPLNPSEIACIAKSAGGYPSNEADAPTAEHPDPGPLPERLFAIPGFVSRVMDLMLTTAPRPNRPLAFAGALALLATLAGRKVCTESDLRTNIYVICLGASGVGKDHPRKVIKVILFTVGWGDALIGSIASGQALEDEVQKHPSCLAMTDEIDELMMAIRQDKTGTRQNLPKVLMELFTSASVHYQTRAKAGQDRFHVDQPNLCLLGTAVPEHFYDSISARMMDDGFLGRSIIVEAGKLGPRQQARRIAIPDDILRDVRYWVDRESEIDWDKEHPKPRVVSLDQDAAKVLDQAADGFDEVQREAQAMGDMSAVSIWARAFEHASKLALLYAISENPDTSVIRRAAAVWAVDFVGHHSRRLIATVNGRVAESAFHALLIRVKSKLRNSPNQTMTRSRLVKNMHIAATDLDKVIGVLIEGGEIQEIGGNQGTPAQRGISYRLVSE
jgi:hypothetical protein